MIDMRPSRILCKRASLANKIAIWSYPSNFVSCPSTAFHQFPPTHYATVPCHSQCQQIPIGLSTRPFHWRQVHRKLLDTDAFDQDLGAMGDERSSRHRRRQRKRSALYQDSDLMGSILWRRADNNKNDNYSSSRDNNNNSGISGTINGSMLITPLLLLLSIISTFCWHFRLEYRIRKKIEP